MKKSSLIILLIMTIAMVSHAQEPAKEAQKDFGDEYKELKAEYTDFLKLDSFYVSVPVISEKFYEGTVDLGNGNIRRHYTKTVIGVQGEWQYPPFTTEGFEAWLDTRKNRPNKEPVKEK